MFDKCDSLSAIQEAHKVFQAIGCSFVLIKATENTTAFVLGREGKSCSFVSQGEHYPFALHVVIVVLYC